MQQLNFIFLFNSLIAYLYTFLLHILLEDIRIDALRQKIVCIIYHLQNNKENSRSSKNAHTNYN